VIDHERLDWLRDHARDFAIGQSVFVWVWDSKFNSPFHVAAIYHGVTPEGHRGPGHIMLTDGRGALILGRSCFLTREECARNRRDQAVRDVALYQSWANQEAEVLKKIDA
jgi:hypothetical protein